MAIAEGELEVQILDEKVITTRPALNVETRTVAITFLAPGLPPLTVWIPKEEDTPEARAAAIRARIQRETPVKRRTLKV